MDRFPKKDSVREIIIGSDMLPKLYTTILELQKAQLEIDSLSVSFQKEQEKVIYTTSQLKDCLKGSDLLNDMLNTMTREKDILEEQNSILGKQTKRLKKWVKLSITIGGVVGIVAILK